MSELSFSTLMPPMCLLIAMLAGVIIAFRWRRAGLAITLISSLLLYACCTSFVSNRLLSWVENQLPPPSPAMLAEGQAIAVLSGDVRYGKFGVPDDVGLLTLERLRMAAALYRAHPLPILVTGGVASDNAPSDAELMEHALAEDYGIKATWLENKAANTFQNGLFSAAILETNNISRVIVVTDAWHLPRAIWAFEHAGITAIPAPAPRTHVGPGFRWTDLEADYGSFAKSFYAFHELLGMAFYRFRYGPIGGAAD
jgi:uncharacterized SAM-binding protein YcdF (DUF218 family)